MDTLNSSNITLEICAGKFEDILLTPSIRKFFLNTFTTLMKDNFKTFSKS